MMRKIKIPTELAYVLGLLIIPFAVEFAKYGDFGLSMVVSPAYLISQFIPKITFGQTEYCVQALLLIVMCIVMRKFKITYFFSFVTAFLYGTLLDFIDTFMCYLPTDSIWLRIVYFFIGMFLTSFSVSLFFNTYFIPQAYDFFVREVSSHFSINRTKCKIVYDWSSFAFSVILAGILYFKTHELTGIGIGTLVCALFNGLLIGRICKFFDKHFEFFDVFKLRRFFE